MTFVLFTDFYASSIAEFTGPPTLEKANSKEAVVVAARMLVLTIVPFVRHILFMATNSITFLGMI